MSQTVYSMFLRENPQKVNQGIYLDTPKIVPNCHKS